MEMGSWSCRTHCCFCCCCCWYTVHLRLSNSIPASAQICGIQSWMSTGVCWLSQGRYKQDHCDARLQSDIHLLLRLLLGNFGWQLHTQHLGHFTQDLRVWDGLAALILIDHTGLLVYLLQQTNQGWYQGACPASQTMHKGILCPPVQAGLVWASFQA